MSGDHTPTPWAVWNVPVVNDKFHRKLGPMIILTGHDDDIVFAAEAVNSYASSQAEIERLRTTLEWVRKNYASGNTTEINTRIEAVLAPVTP